jgi:hypothetical protein
MLGGWSDLRDFSGRLQVALVSRIVACEYVDLNERKYGEQFFSTTSMAENAGN